MRPLVIALLACFLVSCHASRPPASASATAAESDPFADDAWPASEGEASTRPAHRESAIASLGITPPDVAWEAMSPADREMYMVGKVLPIMKELFARHDAGRYGALGCETCHGREMRDVAFRMPPRAALPVPPVGTPAFARLERRFPDGVHFMRETVTPTMGTLLGVDDYTCAHCHPTASAE